MLHDATLSESVLRPTYVTVDLNAIARNYKKIFAKAGSAKVMIVLKANAYGHGLIRIARHLEELKVEYFGVAYLEEGILLREAGIKTPILVLGGIIGAQIPQFINFDLTITASSVDKLMDIDRTAKALGRRAQVHLKIDTGMERIGVHYYSAKKLLENSLSCTNTDIEGVYTHFANAHEADRSYTELQINRFNEVLSFYKDRGLDTPMTHAGNSGSFLQSKQGLYDMVRIGILLFGVYPADHLRGHLNLEPALNWKSHVVFFKVVKPGHPVSYGSTWESDVETRIVTCPVGYGDGYLRAMSHQAHVLIRGQKYPVAGNICMDQLMVNIGWDTGYNADEVILIGRQGDKEIKVEDLAKWAGTIPYEILTNINTRVPRVYIQYFQPFQQL